MTINSHDRPPAPLLTYQQLAGWLNDSVRHLRRLVDEQRIPYHEVGHFVRFDEAEITHWLADNHHSHRPGEQHPLRGGRNGARRSLPGRKRGQASAPDIADVRKRRRTTGDGG